MNTKWAVLGGCAAIALAVAIGCDTSGGSSYDDGPGSTNKPVVLQICFGVPVCSTVGEGSLNGAVFNAGAGYLYVAPACTGPNAGMFVWLKVVTSASPSQVDHYIWTIRNWTGASPDGVFTADSYDSLIDTNGVFKVRTSANQIRYRSATAGDLLALASLYDQMIDVTAVTKDGQMATGYISLLLYNGMTTGGATVFGSLNNRDNPSQARPGSFADYYSLMGLGTTNMLDLEGDFDTYLALYDANLNEVAINDDVIPGLDLNSRIVSFLTNGATYFVEATSLSNQTAGSYSLSTSTDQLSPVPNPFDASGTCDSVAGIYSVTETLAVDLTFDGKSYAFTNVSTRNVLVTQTGCEFSYPVIDPTGLIPPTLLRGRVVYSDLALHNETIIPQTPEIFISSSAVTGVGNSFSSGLSMDSAGTITGTFLGVPFTVSYTSGALFSK